MTSKEAVQISYQLLADMQPVVEVGDEVSPKMVIAKAETQKGTLKASEEGKVVAIENGKIITQSLGPVTKTYLVPQMRT